MKKHSIRGSLRFILMVAALSLPISGVFDTSTIFLNRASWYIGLLIVFLIIIIGVVFDMVGVAAAAGTETPLHAMASKRVFGARRAIAIVRNAEKVASVCSDVVGDIAGVLSGAGSLAVAGQMAESLGVSPFVKEFIVIALTAVATSVTVGAKAIGKTVAIHSPTPIILWAARLVDTVWILPVSKDRIKRSPRNG